MMWQIMIEDAVINRLPYKDLVDVLDLELETKRKEILRQLRAARQQFGLDVGDGNSDE